MRRTDVTTILYFNDTSHSDVGLFETLEAAGYRVVAPRSSQHAIISSVIQEFDAVVIQGKLSDSVVAVAEKLKFLNSYLPVLLISTEPESHRPTPPGIDAITYSDTPESAVCVLTTFIASRSLQSRRALA